MADNNKPTIIDPTDIVTVDLHNPTRARRVIYDGIGKVPKSIVVEAGEDKKNVRIHRMVETELNARNQIKKDSDLVVIRVGESQAA